MALIPTLTRGAVDSELKFFYLTDSTGVYNVTTNPGGYGTPNPDRNTLALYIYGYKYNQDPKSTDSILTISNTIPLTVTQWQVPIITDGYYYFKILAIPIWTTSAYSYDVNNPNIIYYAGSYYKSLQASTNQIPNIVNSLYWILISDLTTDSSILSNNTIYINSFDTVLNYFGKACYQTQIFKESSNNCNCEEGRNDVRPYQRIFVMLNAASLLCAQQKYPQSDEALINLSAYCASIDCKTCN